MEQQKKLIEDLLALKDSVSEKEDPLVEEDFVQSSWQRVYPSHS